MYLLQSSESFEFHEAEILQELSRLRNDLEHVLRGLPKVPVSDEGFRGKWEWVFVVTNWWFSKGIPHGPKSPQILLISLGLGILVIAIHK